MSIRSLTIRLREETEELRKRRRFDLSRAKDVAPAASAPPQPTYRPLPEATPLPMARQVRLKKRAEEETWRIPGGIAARFGRHALQHSQPVAQPAAEMPIPIPEALPEVASNTQQQPPKPEREAREEATRITIELQSH